MDMSGKRDLGNLGESLFTTLCHQVGMIPNPSKIDKTGWDFIVEFPQEDELASDKLHESPTEFRIQVKSTDDRKGKIQLKLSNLKRMCTAQKPEFLLVFEFDGKNDAQKAYLVHIDNVLTTKILKKIHEKNQNEPKRKLHKCNMSISYSDAHKLEEITGSALQGAIQKYIGKSYSKYLEYKNNHLEKTGYETGYGNITFKLKKDQYSELADSMNGIKKRISVTDIKGFKERFGIQEATPFLAAEIGMIEFTPTDLIFDGKIIIRLEDFGKRISFNCRIFAGGMHPFFPEDNRSIRMVCTHFEFLLYPSKNNINYRILYKEDTVLSLSELKLILDLGL